MDRAACCVSYVRPAWTGFEGCEPGCWMTSRHLNGTLGVVKRRPDWVVTRRVERTPCQGARGLNSSGYAVTLGIHVRGVIWGSEERLTGTAVWPPSSLWSRLQPLDSLSRWCLFQGGTVIRRSGRVSRASGVRCLLGSRWECAEYRRTPALTADFCGDRASTWVSSQTRCQDSAQAQIEIQIEPSTRTFLS